MPAAQLSLAFPAGQRALRDTWPGARHVPSEEHFRTKDCGPSIHCAGTGGWRQGTETGCSDRVAPSNPPSSPGPHTV